jgi:three-Cys-motif partner protein
VVSCIQCKEEQIKDEDGICPFKLGEDNLSLRCVGTWALDKLYYLKRYIEAFNSAMKDKWSNRVYIELFSGPGLGIIRDTEKIVDGSPIIAVKQQISFSRYVFVDINSNATEALELRVKRLERRVDVRFLTRDCNEAADKIRSNIDENSLCLAFIDPTSTQINFSTIQHLTKNVKMDLIVNFPLQAINRSYYAALHGYVEKFDNYFGTDNWKPVIMGNSDIHNIGTRLLDLYRR